MLAVCTNASLVLLDPPTLKKAPPTVPTTHTLPSPPTASAWAPDNSALFVAHGNAIHRYDPTGTPLDAGAPTPTAEPVTALACKDKGSTVIYGSEEQVTVLDAASGKVAFRLDTHTGPVSALALSPDATLLASAARPRAPGGPSEVHVHNLAGAAPHAEVQGLPRRGDVRACVFHPHSKTRLLLGVGAQLLVYDAAKPGAPVKTVQLDRKSGDAVAIACSPFSKTLVAVGGSAGVVNLVDLDKEKGLFRTLPLDTHLTSLAFSPEGAALYAGTEDGRLLILDLRALDKPAKVIEVSSDGQRVVCMSVQRKLKPGESPRAGLRPSATALGKRRMPAEITNSAAIATKSAASPSPSAGLLKPRSSNAGRTSLSPGPSPARVPRSRAVSTTTSTPPKSKLDASKSTPPAPRLRPGVPQEQRSESTSHSTVVPMRARTVSAATSASSRVTSGTSSSRATRLSSSATSVTSVATSPPTRKVSGGARRPLSPPKSPLLSTAEDLTEHAEKPRPITKKVSTLPSSSSQDKSPRQSIARSRTVSGTSTRSISTRASVGSGDVRPSASTNAVASSSSHAPTRTRTLSSRTSASTAAVPRPASRPQSRTSALTVSPIPPVPPLPVAFKDTEQLTEIDIKWSASRTPSPDPRDDNDNPLADTPMPARRRDKGKGRAAPAPQGPRTNVLGLGTPELKRWIEAEGADAADADAPDEARREGRRVGFLEVPPNEVQIQSIQVVGSDGDAPPDTAAAATQTIQMTVQISPRRSQEHLSPHWAPIPSLFSPARNAGAHAHGAPGAEQGQGPSSAGANPAHELLQSLIRDAMYDFRRETKAEIIGLHLDVVRMGRGWRKELREALEQWGEELKEIRRENELLRQENERLRRGY